MNDGRYVYETKRQGRIAHHHTDATVPHIVALLGSTFHAAKIETFFETSKYFAKILARCHGCQGTDTVLKTKLFG